MPFTRPPLAYPFPRLLYRVLLDLHSWVDVYPIPPADRPDWEAALVQLWGLDTAREAGLLRRYQFRWTPGGHLRDVWLVPTEAHRRSPGIRDLREWFGDPVGLDILPRKKVAPPDHIRPPFPLLYIHGTGFAGAPKRPTMSDEALNPVNPQTGKRPPGRPRKERPSKPHLLPPLDIDLNQTPDEITLPCSEVEQARYLTWRLGEVRSVNRTLSLYDNIPMLCQGADCHWAKLCPTAAKAFPFQGMRCPFEVRQLFRQFVQYVRELEVSPWDYADLALIGDLCRVDLQIKRIDQQVQVEGMFIEKIGGIAQATSTVFKEKAVNPLLERQGKLRAERLQLYKNLMISREAMWKRRKEEGSQQFNLVNVMTALRTAAQEQEVEIIDVTALSVVHSHEPELSDEDLDPFGSEGE